MTRLIALAALILPSSVHAAWELDTLLNTIQMDARTSKAAENRYWKTSPEAPLGQTFTTGEQVEKIFRIAIWQAFWSDSWQPDEILVLTLWDSPKKQTSLGRFSVPYSRRMWEGAITMFTIDANAMPNHEYYFELTVETESIRPAIIPREWLLATTRPAIANGDRVIDGIGIAREPYAHGSAYLGGKPQAESVWFEVHVKRHVERDVLYEHAFSYLDLDYAPLKEVRAAVETRNWDLAVKELIRHFESRTDLLDPKRRTPKYDPAYDTLEADLAADQKVLQKNGPPEDLSPNWNYCALWPERGGVGLTRGGMRKPLAEGYERTGNDKYARAFNDMLAHFYINCPSPIQANVYRLDQTIPASLPYGLAGGSVWSALSIGARMIHGFHYYATFSNTPIFEPSVRAKFIFNMAEMAEVLERMHGGGNWETQISDALFEFGLTYPEYKGSRNRVKMGLDRIIDNASKTVYPDGCLHEPTINYHNLVLNRYSKVIERCRTQKLDVPESLVRLTEKMFEVEMYSAMPDCSMPAWGDSAPPYRSDVLERGAQLYSRDDFRYVVSCRRQGKPPARTDYAFPDGGFYFMRTGWEDDAQYLAIRCGPFGSHGHCDPLSIVTAAYGRTILIDPGIHTYGTPQSEELHSTRSHNTVTVDDRNSRSSKADAWIASRHFAFFAGRNAGYEGVKETIHHRRVWFLKPFIGHPALSVIFDDMTGQGEHATTLRYRFAPLSIENDAVANRVWTSGDGGNLLIQAIAGNSLKTESGKGIAVWNGDLIQVPVVNFTQNGELPLHVISLLAPYKDKQAPVWNMRPLPFDGKAMTARILWAETDTAAVLLACNDLPSLHEQPQALLGKFPDGKTFGMLAAGVAIRFSKSTDGWKPVAVHGVRGKLVQWNGKPIYERSELTESFDEALK